jgi:hypothetical protein
MTRLARRRRLRVFGASGTALLLSVGVVVALTVAGGAPRAAANPAGAAPKVYLTGNTGNGGLVRALSLGAVESGGAGSAGITGIPPGAAVGPVAMNITATFALIGTSTDAGSFQVSAVAVNTGAVAGQPTALNATPIGIAANPTNAGSAFVLLSSGEVDEIQIGVTNPTAQVVASLPGDIGDQLRVTPRSIAVSPDGATVYVGWGDRGGYGVDAIDVASQQVTGQWFAAAVDFPRVADLAVAPNGKQIFGVETDGFTASAAFAVSTPIHTGQAASWSTALQSIASPVPLANGRALTVSPDGTRIYVGGTSGNNGSSVVVSLLAVPVGVSKAGTPQGSRPVAMATNSDGVGGLSGLAASPDGGTLLAAGVDSTSGHAEIAPLRLPSLQVVASATVFSNFGSTDTPQDIAITPDQAPVAQIVAPSAVQVGQTITFDASSSTVAFGAVNSFSWNFGDGSGLSAPSSEVVSHSYAAPGTYQVTVTETDSAGTSIPPAVASFSVNGPGQTPYRRADPSARTSFTVSVTTTPTTNSTPTTSTPGTTGTTNTTTPTHGSTTTTTVKGHAPGTPTLILNPAVGSPGTIVTVTGHGFRPNKPVTVSWTVSTGSVVITADAHGNLPPRTLLILTPDVLGPRDARASSSPPATAPFLVVPSTSEPGGDNAGLLFRSEGP